MLIDFLRVLLWVGLCTLVAVIEYSTGLPLLSITLILIAVSTLSTVWFIFFVTLMSVLLSSLFLESWSVVWLLVMASAILFRIPSNKSRKTFISRLSIICIAALLLSLIREPSVTISFLIHTAISLIASSYLLWRNIMPKHKGFDVAELRFMSEE